jgi:hypothetical protein
MGRRSNWGLRVIQSGARRRCRVFGASVQSNVSFYHPFSGQRHAPTDCHAYWKPQLRFVMRSHGSQWQAPRSLLGEPLHLGGQSHHLCTFLFTGSGYITQHLLMAQRLDRLMNLRNPLGSAHCIRWAENSGGNRIVRRSRVSVAGRDAP